MTPPLVIGYVGNYRHPWCTEVHVAGSLEALGHTVHRLQEDEVQWPGLPDRLDALGAQLLLWTRTWPMELDVVVPVLEELRKRGVPSVSYHLDRWFGLNREHQVREQPFFHTDLVVSPDDSPRWAEEGVEHLWLPPGVYHAECVEVRPEPRRWPFDVVFVGSHPYPHPEWRPYRDELIATFRARFGRRFQVLPRKGQPIRGTALAKLYASVPLVIGDSCLAGESHGYWSDRIPETLGRGGVLIHPEVADVEGGWAVGEDATWYENGRDLATYQLGEFTDAADIAAALVADPDRRAYLASRGRATVLGRDTYQHRLAAVLERVELHHEWRASEPTVPRTAVADEVGRHKAVRQTVSFQLAQGETDRTAVREVWQDDTYQLHGADVRGKTVLDIGANVGAFTVLAHKLGASRVVAYEPHPATFEALVENVRRHTTGRGVDARNAAVGATDGAGQLEGDGGGATLRPAALPATLGPVVPIEGVNGVVGALGGRVGLLKLDCEGGEYAIVEALDLAMVDAIVGEWHGPLMPHLAHLADIDRMEVGRWVATGTDPATPEDVEVVSLAGWVDRVWSPFVARLVDHGRLELFGHPKMGGTFRWRRY